MSDINLPSVTRSDLPALYRAASTASSNAQTAYLRLLKANLLTLLIGSLLTSVSISDLSSQRWLAGIGGVLFTISLFLALRVNEGNYERKWYAARAMTESIKTLAWKYMCGAAPFEVSRAPQEVDQLFQDSLRRVLQAENFAISPGISATDQPQITEKMRQIRAETLEQRKSLYVKDRIQGQLDWYKDKALANNVQEGCYSNAIAFAQFLTIAFSFVLVAYPDVKVNLPSVFSTLAASLLAWVQIKRYKELVPAYSVTAQELSLVALDARYAVDEPSFAKFVLDSESAISREHTLWVARRRDDRPISQEGIEGG